METRISTSLEIRKYLHIEKYAIIEASLFLFPLTNLNARLVYQRPPGNLSYYMLAALIFSVMLFRQLKKGRNGNSNGLPLPPGPKGYPLIGNLFDMPVHKPWVVYDEWRMTYGKYFIINRLSLQITGHSR